jgi:hypothetical protein
MPDSSAHDWKFNSSQVSLDRIDAALDTVPSLVVGFQVHVSVSKCLISTARTLLQQAFNLAVRDWGARFPLRIALDNFPAVGTVSICRGWVRWSTPTDKIQPTILQAPSIARCGL